MEIKNEVKAKDRIKSFVKNNYGTIIISGVSLTVGCLLCYKVGHGRGVRQGRNNLLDEIVNVSCENGLIMINPELGRYVFTAKKLDD